MYIYNLFQLFENVARSNGHRPALCFEDKIINYHELADRALRTSNSLIEWGISIGDVICICSEKCPEVYALILGCLKVGAPYVMLDPESPLERQQKILNRCKPIMLIGDEDVLEQGLKALGTRLGIKSVSLQNFIISSLGSKSKIQNALVPNGNHPAYIMFTSGSTGFPKGAVMSQQNVLRLISWSRDYFSLGPGDILTNVNPLYFDNSVFDIYSSLFTGAALAPFTRSETRSPKSLLDGVAARGCTSWFSVPSLLMYLDSLRALNSDAMPNVKRIIFGGEGYPKARLKKLFDTFGSRAEIINVYGPTECTCICSAYRLHEDDFADLQGFPPLGNLTPEFVGFIIDENGQPVKEGMSGELILGGPCVGQGYFNDPERTKQYFHQSPIQKDYSEIMYYTGDIVHRDAENGKFWIHGRRDNQIKHMGYRIELEEIENALCTIPGIYQAVAVHGKKYGNSCIDAVVCCEPSLNEKYLINLLQERLPQYMLPSSILFFDSLPKNQNGKLDRIEIRKLIENKKVINSIDK